ncbi:MAG: IS66 family insertion sequence element accessory protein TnpA, partial [Armatimonadota bacterium]
MNRRSLGFILSSLLSARRTCDDEAKLRRLWRDRVADYWASELSVREWCARNGVSANALRYWLKRIGVEAGAVEWASVEIVEGPASIESS